MGDYGADGRISYHFGEAMDVSQAIGQYVGHVEEALGELARQFQSGLSDTGDGWAGIASSACAVAKGKWDKGVDDIKQALSGVGVNLGGSIQEMQSTEHSIAAGFEV